MQIPFSSFLSSLNKVTLLFFLILSGYIAKADSKYTPPLKRFIDCTVVIDGDYVKSNSNYFWVRINHVLRDDSLGLISGDYLRIQKKNRSECGFPTDVSITSRAYYYLNKINNGWKLYKNESSSIQAIEIDRMHIALRDTVFALEGKEFRRLMTEFAKVFIWNKTYHHVDIKVGSKKLTSIRRENLIVNKFMRYDRSLNSVEFSSQKIGIEKAEPVPDPIYREPKPLKNCTFLEQPAYYKTAKGDSLLKYIQDHISYPNILIEQDIQGVVYVEFIVEKDGALSTFKILRSLHKSLDKEAIEVLRHMPYWNPAKERGIEERCKMVVPVRFK